MAGDVQEPWRRNPTRGEWIDAAVDGWVSGHARKGLSPRVQPGVFRAVLEATVPHDVSPSLLEQLPPDKADGQVNWVRGRYRAVDTCALGVTSEGDVSVARIVRDKEGTIALPGGRVDLIPKSLRVEDFESLDDYVQAVVSTEPNLAEEAIREVGEEVGKRLRAMMPWIAERKMVDKSKN